MKRILYLPLDDRPCNAEFPKRLFQHGPVEILTAPMNFMPKKRLPGNRDALADWLTANLSNIDALVISLDLLVYGGLLPSRLHQEDLQSLRERLQVLSIVKQIAPACQIYAFQVVMRCPGYNSMDGEPSYFQEYGKRIHRTGVLKHRLELGVATPAEQSELRQILVPQELLSDFENRRNINLAITIDVLHLLHSQIIDFLLIPQDDSSEIGYTSKDQERIRQAIEELRLQTKVYLYPGADEIGMQLIARAINLLTKKRFFVYLKYPSITSGMIIPNIEDRYLDTTVRYQILTAGGFVTNCLQEADAVLFVNAPSDHMLSSLTRTKEGRGFTAQRNLEEVFEFLVYAKREAKKAIWIADVAYGNGSTLEMIRYLQAKELLFDVDAYAGWNTASNSIGSTIAMGVAKLHQFDVMPFLYERYLEDVAFGGYIRQVLRDEILPQFKSTSVFDISRHQQEIETILKEKLEEFIQKEIPELSRRIQILSASLPWQRLYDVQLRLTLS